LELITRRNCTVIGIDPTEKAARYIRQHSNPRYQFLQRALAEKGRSTIRMYKNTNPNYVSESIDPAHKSVASDQFYEAQTVCLDELLHTYPNVSVFKMDIEGAEYSVLSSLRGLEIPQICVEFHHFCTNRTVEDTLSCIEELGRMGYVVAHATGKAAPLQQVTFIHSKNLPKMLVQQSSGVNSMCSCV
jgi:FkbM family methyltransferase